MRRPGPDNDAVELTRKLPGFQRLASQSFRSSTRALRRAQPVFEFARPYTPELTGFLRDFGQSASAYDANGHYARVAPQFNAFSFTENGSGGVLSPRPARQPLRRPADRRGPALPRRGQPGAAGRLGAVHRPGEPQLPGLRPQPRAARAMSRVRVLAVVAVLAVCAAVAIIAAGATAGDGAYKVRAIFDNAGFLVAGEDVKVAGVKVGVIDSLTVTEDFKAAVVMDIQDPGYRDFRADASCIVRPQGLIGEKYVECEPTQERAAGAPAPAALGRIASGPGEGQYLLPVTNTQKATDLDLVNDIMRLPYRERFSIILNELGTGVAGRGNDLDEVIRRAAPALKETDEVLAILARQNRTLADLARDADTVLAPLARDRARVAGAIENAGEVAQATAERRGALADDLERLPPFLRELEPTMARLGSLSDAMTPVLDDLGRAAPDVNRVVEGLGPFSDSATTSLVSLGDATEIGTPAVQGALPIVKDLRSFAKVADPVGAKLSSLLRSFEGSNGIESLMDFLLYSTTAVNGFDTYGHYLRARLLVNTCSTYTVNRLELCSSNFPEPVPEEDEAAEEAADPALRRVAATERPGADRAASPAPVRPRARKAPARPRRPAGRTEAAPAEDEQSEALLDYLFGKDGS